MEDRHDCNEQFCSLGDDCACVMHKVEDGGTIVWHVDQYGNRWTMKDLAK
jgi:hypothetical protein